MTITYRALTKQGHMVRGSLPFKSKHSAVHYLKNTQLDVVSLKHTFNFSDKPNLTELSTFCHYLEYFQRAGISIAQSLRLMEESFTKTSLRAIIPFLYERIREGESFSKALAYFPHLFDGMMIALVQVGEQTGNSAHVFEKLKKHFIWQANLRQTLIQKLRYPLVLLIATLVLFCVVMQFLVPSLEGFLSFIAADHTVMTRALFAMSSFFNTYYGIIFSAIGGSVFCVFILSTMNTGKLFLQHILTKTPFVCTFYYTIFLNRWIHDMDLLLGEHVGLIPALETAEANCTHLPLRNTLIHMRTSILGGVSLSESAKIYLDLPPFIGHMIDVGEKTSSLSEGFHQSHAFNDSHFTHKIDQLMGLIEPCLIGLSGGLMLWVVWGIFMPLYDNLNTIGVNP